MGELRSLNVKKNSLLVQHIEKTRGSLLKAGVPQCDIPKVFNEAREILLTIEVPKHRRVEIPGGELGDQVVKILEDYNKCLAGCVKTIVFLVAGKYFPID